ncbi:alpha/beta hydrolase [Streptomyces hyaluromycini]|uniref:alpha/beta hydrolase n=1 Tax=Streptomyces hyaluromycini TaxID=1377993 RepID=UPI000B5C8288|nr:alpha/beta hydrolase [Streptomyces hyaluromycini]
MSVDPQVRALLDELAETGAQPVENLTVAEARLASKDFLLLQGDPEHVAWVEDRLVAGPTAEVPVRLYYPAGDGPFPCLVYFHGGGWVTLDIDVCDPTARALANDTGCVVVSVDYRKAPEHKFPAAVDDAWASTTWVAENAAELNIDPDRIGVIGDSSGGNLAAVTALRTRDVGAPALACQILIHPPTDHNTDKRSYLDNAEGYLLQRRSMQWFYGHYLNDPSEGTNPWVSPLRAQDLSGLPRTLVVTAQYDPLRDDGRLYAERLAAAGTPTRHDDYSGVIHAFYLMWGVLDAGRQLRREIAEEVREALRVSPSA